MSNYRIKLVIFKNIQIPMIIFDNTEESECSQMIILIQENLKWFAGD